MILPFWCDLDIVQLLHELSHSKFAWSHKAAITNLHDDWRWFPIQSVRAKQEQRQHTRLIGLQQQPAQCSRREGASAYISPIIAAKADDACVLRIVHLCKREVTSSWLGACVGSHHIMPRSYNCAARQYECVTRSYDHSSCKNIGDNNNIKTINFKI